MILKLKTTNVLNNQCEKDFTYINTSAISYYKFLESQKLTKIVMLNGHEICVAMNGDELLKEINKKPGKRVSK